MAYNQNVAYRVDGDDFVTADDKVMRVLENVGDGVEIVLYRLNTEQIRVDKTNFLISVGTIYGVFRSEFSITQPTFEVDRDMVDFNYVYIPTFNRYYYVTDFSSTRNGMWDIMCSVDILHSNKDLIKSLTAFVDRNENTYNDLIVDNRIVVYDGYSVETRDITTDDSLYYADDVDWYDSNIAPFLINGYKFAVRADAPAPQ